MVFPDEIPKATNEMIEAFLNDKLEQHYPSEKMVQDTKVKFVNS